MARSPGRREPRRDHAAVLVRQDDGATWSPDVVVAVNVSESWQVTDHPVEDGVVVSDHVQQQPATIVLSCVLTENPTRVGSRTGGRAHLQDGIAWLRDTAAAGQLVDVVTSRMGTFTGYVVQGIPYTIDRVARLAFDLTLRQVRVATSTTVQITVDDTAADTATGAPDEVDAGEQATTSTADDAAAEEADQSTLAALLDTL